MSSKKIAFMSGANSVQELLRYICAQTTLGARPQTPKNIGERLVFTLGATLLEFSSSSEHKYEQFAYINKLLCIPPISSAGLVVSEKSRNLLEGLGKYLFGNRSMDRGKVKYAQNASNERIRGSAGHKLMRLSKLSKKLFYYFVYDFAPWHDIFHLFMVKRGEQ